MAVTLNASTSAGAVITPDTSGILALQTAGTTAVTVGTDQSFNFTATGQRITGDFSNATVANRVMFQNSVTNAASLISVLPNGTGNTSYFITFGNSNPTNAAFGQFGTSGVSTSVRSEITGTGTYLPMTFHTGGSERARIDTSGNVLVTNVAGLGYGTGSGGTVTQATSRVTAVTINKPTGAITMFTAAGSATPASFTVNNSLVANTDIIVVSIKGGATNTYVISAQAVQTGLFILTFYTTGGVVSDAPVINFAIIKGATS
jgi:hypothetical protein